MLKFQDLGWNSSLTKTLVQKGVSGQKEKTQTLEELAGFV